jgi:hypothetical protein
LKDAITYFDVMIAVPGVLSHLTDFSYHRYGSGSTETTPALLAQIASRASTHGLHASVLKFIGADYHTLCQDLKSGNNSASQQFALASPETDNVAQDYWIDNGNPSNPQLNIGSRTKFLRQYFKFIRAGTHCIGAGSASGSLDRVAFIREQEVCGGGEGEWAGEFFGGRAAFGKVWH